jgi:zinc-binding alcohol dehydrogenase/oxidoreductase
LGHVLVEMQASALNHRDLWITRGLYPGIREGSVLGSDGSGVVVATASDSPSVTVGEEVILNAGVGWGDNEHRPALDFGVLGLLPHAGTLQQYVSVPRRQLYRKPAHLSFTEAAALPLAGVTAYR